MATNLFFKRVRRFGPLINWFLKAAAFGAVVVLLWTPPALARGGGGHGIGGFRVHGGGRMGRGERLMAPAYVLITVSSVSDADAFKKAIQNMTTAVASFSVRIRLGMHTVTERVPRRTVEA